MKYISYKEGVETTLNWDYKKLLCVAFVEQDCDACNSFFDLVCPEIDQMDIEVKCIDLRKNVIPFPPVSTPTTYWYLKNDIPPMQKKGIPPNKVILLDQVKKMKHVFENKLDVEEAFM